MLAVSALECGRTRFGQAKVADLSLLDELGHGADRFLDRNRAIHPMLVVEIDVVDAESLERTIARLPNILRPAVHSEKAAVLPALVAELGGEYDLVAPPADSAAHQPLVGEGSVHVGRVEEVDLQIQRAMNGRDRLLVIRAAIELRHAHAAQTQSRDAEAFTAKSTM